MVKVKLLKKINLIELIIFICSISGTIFVSSLNGTIQLIGFWCWLIANIIGIFFFYKKNMYILMTQYIFFLIITIIAIYIRM